MERDMREEWFDSELKLAVTFADVTGAAQELVRAHLSGPVAGRYLARALAAVALLGAETSTSDECVSMQGKCTGPLGGFNVECTADGALRGYTEKKILDEFDGLGAVDDAQILGDLRLQVTRSVPGRILSQGLSTSLDGYLSDSLQRRARIFLEAEVTDELEVLGARGALVEAMPDSPLAGVTDIRPRSLAVASRTLLKALGAPQAKLRRTTPLRFACRCSPERAAAMLSALSAEERATLPEKIDITCHMCGRTFTVPRGVA